MVEKFKLYYSLTKPGIIYGNALTTAAGFLLASEGFINFQLLLAVLFGSSLVIASGCVFNNYIDRDIDQKMARTKNRVLVTGLVPVKAAIIFAVCLGILGFFILEIYTNILTVSVGLVGLFFYVVIYGFFKRRTVHGTLIGSISGATPPVAGYVAVTNHLDLGALLLFLVLVFWQMPHFYAIAIYRLKDYANAAIPVLSVKKGVHVTVISMLLYIVGYICAVSALALFGYTSYIFMVVLVLLGVWWLWKGLAGLSTKDPDRWARKMFGFSLVVVLSFYLMVLVDVVLKRI